MNFQQNDPLFDVLDALVEQINSDQPLATTEPIQNGQFVSHDETLSDDIGEMPLQHPLYLVVLQ